MLLVHRVYRPLLELGLVARPIITSIARPIHVLLVHRVHRLILVLGLVPVYLDILRLDLGLVWSVLRYALREATVS